MKNIMIIGLMILSTSSWAKIVKSFDKDHGCDLYRNTKTESEELKPGETIVLNKIAYGISIVDMDIDFDRQEVSVQPRVNVVMGLDRSLVPNRIIISRSNQEFKVLVNQLNQKITSFERICINHRNELVYARINKGN